MVGAPTGGRKTCVNVSGEAEQPDSKWMLVLLVHLALKHKAVVYFISAVPVRRVTAYRRPIYRDPECEGNRLEFRTAISRR